MPSPYKLIENYIYIYQLDKYVIVPVYPDSLQDTFFQHILRSIPTHLQHLPTYNITFTYI